MTKKIIEELKMGRIACSSYLASTYGVLKQAGFWDLHEYLMAGMTGMAFHFIVHQSACPSSITVYDWQQDHFMMLDRIGILADTFNICKDAKVNTYEQACQLAVKRIKESIDRGVGVVVWAPSPMLEFGIIKGYDDQDGVFLIEDFICGSNPDPLLYTNLGKAEVPILSYQIIQQKVEVPVEKVIRESLVYGVQEWEKDFHINQQYASGRQGYNNLISTMEKRDYDSFGLSYILFSYADAKRSISKYLEYILEAHENEVINEYNKDKEGLTEAAELYHKVAAKYTEIDQLVDFTGPGSGIKAGKIGDLLCLIKDSYENN